MLMVEMTPIAQELTERAAPRPSGGSNILASVVISNYNYARFLRDAIDSALNQTYPHIEVVVVDDGSTDYSREIIAGYGDHIVPVYKENGGHASAINAGFEASRGDVICLLDADDLFLPRKVSRVVRAFAANPRATLVYHPLQAIDGQLAGIGRPWPRAVWRGDIRHQVERSGGWWPHPTTSALAFRRSFAGRLLPVPPPNRTTYPDTYLAGPAAFVGPVVGLRGSLALFRLHGQNMSYWGRQADDDDAERTREKFRRNRDQYVDEFHRLKRSLERLGISAPSLSLDDHLPYQRYRRALGEPVSLSRLSISALRCPALPAPMRLTEAVRVILNIR
ncbi:MAG: glycosyltransferase [Chloroflexota bacterium]|nr:glycosyltransferase [Chloroflexota bacterium]